MATTQPEAMRIAGEIREKVMVALNAADTDMITASPDKEVKPGDTILFLWAALSASLEWLAIRDSAASEGRIKVATSVASWNRVAQIMSQNFQAKVDRDHNDQRTPG